MLAKTKVVETLQNQKSPEKETVIVLIKLITRLNWAQCSKMVEME